jgi:hypothetical protein
MSVCKPWGPQASSFLHSLPSERCRSLYSGNGYGYAAVLLLVQSDRILPALLPVTLHAVPAMTCFFLI